MRYPALPSSIAVLLSVAISAAPAWANDITENYDFSGTLATAIGGGTSVTGTFTVDFTTSAVTAFDFSTPIGTVDSTNFTSQFNTFLPAVSPNADFVQVGFFSGQSDLSLNFETDLASFSSGPSTPLYTPTYEPVSGGSTQSTLACDPQFGGINCSPVGTSSFSSGAASLVVTTPAAPEPSSLAVLGMALAGVGLARRRKSS